MPRTRPQVHSKSERRTAAREAQPVAAPPRAWAVVGVAAAAGLAAFLLFRLASQAARAQFYTDECFHAYAAEWIARHGRFPADFPEFYAGFYYYYPPLLHLLGAAWVALLGIPTLDLLNVVLFGLLLVTAACPIVPGSPAAPRRWAVLLLVSHHWLALYAVRFYVEMLITLLALVVALLIFRFQRTARMRDAVWLGVAAGLAVVAKQTGVLAPIVVAFAAVAAAIRRDRERRRGYLVACAVALGISLPYFVRNAVLFGSPVYPLGAAETAAQVWALRLKPLRPPPSLFYQDALSAIGPTVLTMAAAAIAAAAWRRRVGALVGVAIGALAVFLTRQASSLFDVRHVMPLVALLAVGGSMMVWDALASRPRVVLAIEAALIVVAALSVARLGELRAGVDVSPRLKVAYDAIRERTPEGATVLSLWTYDTFYYSRRPAIWPVEWSRGEQPFELFYERDPDRFEALLRRFRVDYMLLPIMRPPPVFNGVNFPQSFMDCVEALGRRGSLSLVWQGQGLALVATGVSRPVPSAPPAPPAP